MSGRRDFLSMPAPENYVAGLGRGATGFTTRSDLGPAREGPSEEQMKAALAERAKQLGQAAPSAYGAVEKKEEEDDEAERFQDPDNEVGLFSSGMNYDKDDDEADRIYQEVDEKMERRRKIRREAREAKEREEHERNNPKIQLLFAADKRALSSVSEEEWAALPEVGDMTGKAKRAREARMNQRSYAVPDSVISAAAQQGQLETSISSEAGDGTMTNFASIGAAQKSALEVRLNSAAASSGTQSNVSGTSTSVDPRGYITALDKSQANGEVPVEDINRARVLLESAVKTNIHNGPGYVALARLEEISNRTSAAKRTLALGMDNCPKSIAVFEEAIRLEKKDNIHNAKIVAARGLKQNPRAIKLWMAAVDLETTTASRKKVLRQGLDHNPSSVELWKALINETEELENVRMLFAKATETVPLSEELWLSYAKISEPQNAQQILNAARKHIPSSSAVWVAACILQEQLGKEEMCDRVMERAVKALVKENAMPKREDWISIAENCEADGAIVTASSIVKATIGWGLDEDDERRDVWLEDATKAKAVAKPETARAILGHAVSVFTMSTTVWHALADLEKHRGNQEGLLNVLERSVNACPNSESLWLLYAREMWQAGRPADARNVIARSFRQLPGNENLYTRAVDFEIEANEFEQARRFLEIARSSSPTDRVYIKSISLERYLGELDTALDLVNTALQTWPSSWKLWAMKGQIYESMSKLKEAQEAYSMGTRACPKAPVLFILLARIQEKQGATVKARSSLERGRAQNQKNPEILVEAVRLERRANNISAAQKLMAEALQQCPESGLLWAEKIMHLESRTQRKPRALEAIKKVENDPILFVVVARIFWGERRLEKAQSWFTRAIVTDSDYGDGWVWYWKFLEMHGTEEKKAEVLSKCILAEPHHGEVWQSVAKDPKWVRKGVEEILKEAAKRAE